jgi:hypothetical protein
VRTEALYSAEGEFIGTNQAITLEDLPVNAKRAFAKKYEGYTVKEAIRLKDRRKVLISFLQKMKKVQLFLK